MSWALWLVAAIAFAVVEMVTTTLFVGPFAIGALAAMGLELAGASIALEVIVFLVVSAAAFMIVRPIALRHRRAPPQIRTGIAALIGQTAVVLEDVSRDAGTVKLAGETWSARPYDDDRVHAAGARVTVVEIQGATALVDD